VLPGYSLIPILSSSTTPAKKTASTTSPWNSSKEKSVQALLDEGQKFSLPRVLRIMDQTCSALQFAHDRHVVHRDIKPANLMLTPDDTVKVTDFGTAKILQMGTVQQTTHVMGTPSYMSPEQVKGRPVDGRSDIFSLGVMLYEMVTGEKPFPGQNITTVIYKIVNEDPTPPRQLDPSVHPGISTVIMKALLKEPEERYQSCREMLDDLRAYRAHSALAGNPQTTAALPNATPPSSCLWASMAGKSAVHTKRKSPPRRRRFLRGPPRRGRLPSCDAPGPLLLLHQRRRRTIFS